MTSSRWSLLTEIVGEAWELDEASCERYLDEVCAGDPSLRTEAEALLSERDKVAGFLEDFPATDLVGPPVSLGQRLGPYELEELIGEGGSGFVFRASDTRLHRSVAVKVLRGRNNPRTERLVREAQTIAALNHPNIVTVYDIGSFERVDYIAMEFVDGIRLDRLIGQGPIPMPAVLKYGGQIAAALASAHGLGVVHRDLKPGNIIIDKADAAKVLDFGLAKHLEDLSGPEEPSSERWGDGLTLQGSIVGTPAYMSPEQVAGKPADDRSDVFSFGALLYEMAAGQKAFPGSTLSEHWNATFNGEPQRLSEVIGRLPSGLECVIQSCLRKDPKERPSINEVLRAIERLRAPPRRSGAKVLAGISALALITVLLLFRFRPAVNPPQPESISLTRLAGYEINGALSPDGKQVAFTWNGGGNFDIYVKTIDSGEIRRLTTDPGHDLHPSWSPDGQNIAFVRISESKRELLVTPARGGAEHLICPIHTFQPKWAGDATLMTNQSIGPAWSPDGRFIAIDDSDGKQPVDSIYLVSMHEREKHRFTFAPVSSAGDYFPAFSPSGRSLAFIRTAASQNQRAELFVQKLGQATARPLISEVGVITGLTWISEDKVVFSSDRSGAQRLWSMSLQQRRPAMLSGTQGDAIEPNALPAEHALVYTTQFWNSDIWRIPLRAGHQPPIKLIASSGIDDSAQYSPDGKHIAFVSDRSGHPEIWFCQADGSIPTQMSHRNGPSVGSPRWSPDGKQIAYDGLANGHSAIFIMNVSRRSSRIFVNGAGDYMMPTWSRDGRRIYFTAQNENKIMRQAVTSGVPEVITNGRGETFEAPDGKCLYQIRWGPGIDQHVWQVPITGGQGVPLAMFEHLDPLRYFAMDANGLYLLSTDHSPWVIVFYDFRTHNFTPVFTMDRSPRLGTPSLSVSPDRRWLIYAQTDQGGSDLMLLRPVR